MAGTAPRTPKPDPAHTGFADVTIQLSMTRRTESQEPDANVRKFAKAAIGRQLGVTDPAAADPFASSNNILRGIANLFLAPPFRLRPTSTLLE